MPCAAPGLLGLVLGVALALGVAACGKTPADATATATASSTSASSTSASSTSTATTASSEVSTTVPADLGAPGCDCSLAREACGDQQYSFQGCHIEAGLWAASVVGEAPSGPFNGRHALFGFAGMDCWPSMCTWVDIYVLDQALDPAIWIAAKQEDPGIKEGPTDLKYIGLSIYLGPEYSESHVEQVFLFGGGMLHKGTASVTDVEQRGSWEVYDPLDPPRIAGHIEIEGTDIAGSFDAPVCGGLANFSWCW